MVADSAKFPEEVSRLILGYVIDGHNTDKACTLVNPIVQVAAVSGIWAQGLCPEFWWRGCRGSVPQVRASLTNGKDGEHCKDQSIWKRLAFLARRLVAESDWPKDVPLWRVVRVAAHGDAYPWTALLALRPTAVEVSRSSTHERVSIASAFVKCPTWFPFDGGFALMLEAERERADGGDTAPWRLWLRMPSTPSGALAISVVLAAPTLSQALGENVSAANFEIRVECRGDVAPALRLDSNGCDSQALMALIRAVCSGSAMGGVIRIGEPPSMDGYPGGCGWIEWRPAQPQVLLS